MSDVKSHKFKAETKKVLNILTHSLYTNREIFLRELLSNASDALDKLRFLRSKGEGIREADLPLEIRLSVDKIAGVLQIADTGLGMNEMELVDHLGTIARSGSERFARENPVPEARDAETAPLTAQLIGRFGVGFYSVFMVAETVEVISRTALGEAAAFVWKSDGEGGFSVRPTTEDEAAACKRGTIIKAKLKKDAAEFLEKYRLQAVIRKHSNFLPFPIYLEGEQLNTTPAIWREPKFSVTQEQYADFYKYLTYDETPPLDTIHLAVDAPVQFNALLFIPGSAQDHLAMQREQWGLDLYARRVLITHAHKEIIPHYLAFIKGVVDTEDLPLNISRETLQENLVLRKISQAVVKQTLSHLEKMAEDKEKYASFWKLHGKYLKFVFNDQAHRERASALLRFASSADSGAALVGLDEYIGRAKEGQKDIWYLAAPSPEAAEVNPHLERFRRKGLEVLYLLDPADEFALNGLGKYKDYAFKSVELAGDKDLDAFTDQTDSPPPPQDLDADEQNAFDRLAQKIRAVLGERITDLRSSSRLTGSPAVLVSPDGVSSSMEKLLRVMQKDDAIPPRALEVNPTHPLIRNLARLHTHNPEDPLTDELILHLFDHLLLLDGYLKDSGLMADRAVKFMDKALTWRTGLF